MAHFRTLIGLTLVAFAPPVLAQRTDDNAVKQADDAFGKSVGDEHIGIYSADDVRGFSPVDAGNVRLEGLNFDQQAFLTGRLVAGNTIRVGISAQGYPFPAPTGIADYEIRKPGAQTIISLGLNYGPFGGKSAEVDAQFPIDGERLGIAVGTGIYHEHEAYGGTPNIFSTAIVGRYKPVEGVEILPFWSRVSLRNEEARSIIFTSGAFLPKRFKRDKFLGQKWADSATDFSNYGLIVHAEPAGFKTSLGVFQSTNAIKQEHFDQLSDVDVDGNVGRRQIFAYGASRYASKSGELRVTRELADGPRRHSLFVTVKGRQQVRRYGAPEVIDILNPAPLGVQDFRPEPTILAPFAPRTTDHITQKTFGVGYQGKWHGVGELSFGVQKTDYRKTGFAPTRPWLFSANAAISISPTIAVYAGYVRGLEEAPVAPNNAVNRNEAPPAIRTTQKDAGVRVKLGARVTAVLGVFDIAKPYFNLDGTDRFLQLGNVRHRGIEFSLAGEIAKGLNVIVGTVILDARVSGDLVNRGIIGRKPIGILGRHNIANLDYQLPWHPPLSINVRFDAKGRQAANAANTLYIPARAGGSVGARYKFKLGNAEMLAHFSIENVTNLFGWNVGGSGFFTPNGSRRYAFSLAADI
jgi:iron complex outermembrane recepter protein